MPSSWQAERTLTRFGRSRARSLTYAGEDCRSRHCPTVENKQHQHKASPSEQESPESARAGTPWTCRQDVQETRTAMSLPARGRLCRRRSPIVPGPSADREV
jgi:hypothetical protein